MTEIMIAALEPRLQKQVESARAAFDRGRPEQTLELCIAVLEAQPSCLTVRKLERAAQLKIAATRKSAVSKLVTAVSAAPFLLGGSMQLKDDPRSALATAERLLRRDPQSIAALCLLGQAATALGWPETAVFAHEAASDLEPDRPDVWISLGSAYLAAGRPADAIGAANQALELQSANAEAQTLLRNASVAETLLKGKWESSGDFREKLHDEPKSGQV
jgi:tetratricopeptide (TPR) repeat protein